MFRNPVRVFFLILILTAVLAVIDLPENYRIQQTIAGKKIDFTVSPPEINVNIGNFQVQKSFRTHLGLDLSGGTHIVLDADMVGIPSAQRNDALEGVRQVIDRRVNFFGVSEPIVHLNFGSLLTRKRQQERHWFFRVLQIRNP